MEMSADLDKFTDGASNQKCRKSNLRLHVFVRIGVSVPSAMGIS